jgi:hypothetical protein
MNGVRLRTTGRVSTPVSVSRACAATSACPSAQPEQHAAHSQGTGQAGRRQQALLCTVNDEEVLAEIHFEHVPRHLRGHTHESTHNASNRANKVHRSGRTSTNIASGSALPISHRQFWLPK